MEWITVNWWWLSAFAIPVGIGTLKFVANKTSWVWDDKIVTLLAGIWDMAKGSIPRNTTGPKKSK